MELDDHFRFVCATFNLPLPVFQALCLNAPPDVELVFEPNAEFIRFMNQYSSCVESQGNRRNERIFRWYIGNTYIVTMILDVVERIELNCTKNINGENYTIKRVQPTTQTDVRRFQSFISKTIPRQNADLPILRYYEKLKALFVTQQRENFSSYDISIGELEITVLDSRDLDHKATVYIQRGDFSTTMRVGSEDELEDAKKEIMYHFRKEQRRVFQL